MQHRRLVYVSRAKPDLTLEELDKIVASAQAFNSEHGVTGALFFNGVSFLQILEGRFMAVNDVLDRVSRDERHSDIRTLSDEDSENRIFSKWAMTLFYLPTSDAAGGDWPERLTPYFEELPASVTPELRRMIGDFEAMSL